MSIILSATHALIHSAVSRPKIFDDRVLINSALASINHLMIRVSVPRDQDSLSVVTTDLLLLHVWTYQPTLRVSSLHTDNEKIFQFSGTYFTPRFISPLFSLLAPVATNLVQESVAVANDVDLQDFNTQ